MSMEEKRQDYPSILARLETLDMRQAAMASAQRQWETEVRIMLNGSPDGDESKPGLLVRLDRIERDISSFKKVFARVWAVMATVIGAVLIKWFGVLERIWDKLTSN